MTQTPLLALKRNTDLTERKYKQKNGLLKFLCFYGKVSQHYDRHNPYVVTFGGN
jgi:hypothetical protein